jgi:hypothetical protein
VAVGVEAVAGMAGAAGAYADASPHVTKIESNSLL